MNSPCTKFDARHSISKQTGDGNADGGNVTLRTCDANIQTSRQESFEMRPFTIIETEGEQGRSRQLIYNGQMIGGETSNNLLMAGTHGASILEVISRLESEFD